MIWAMALALLGALGTTAYSVYHSLRTNKRQAMENGVPVGRIDWAVIVYDKLKKRSVQTQKTT